MLESLNRSVVVAGAMMTLLIAVPAAIATAWLSDGDTDESNWTLLALLAIVIAYLLGGALAGRAMPATPFIHGAAATLLAFVIVQGTGIVLRLVRGDDVNLVALVFNGLLAASFGTFGAWFGARWAARTPPHRP